METSKEATNPKEETHVAMADASPSYYSNNHGPHLVKSSMGRQTGCWRLHDDEFIKCNWWDKGGWWDIGPTLGRSQHAYDESRVVCYRRYGTHLLHVLVECWEVENIWQEAATKAKGGGVGMKIARHVLLMHLCSPLGWLETPILMLQQCFMRWHDFARLLLQTKQNQ